MKKPRMRYVDAFPVDIDGRKLIYLRDPEGVASGMAVPYPAYLLMTLMDGTRVVSQLQTALSQELKGIQIANADIEQLICQLDEAFLLDNGRFRGRRRQIEHDFRALPVRPAAHAGKSYPDDAEELRAMIDGFFTSPNGSGVPNGKTGAPLKGLIAPHIDFNRGGPCFAWAYKTLAESAPPDLFVLLGTGHSARQAFVMSRKDFETPFGVLKADIEVIDHIASVSPIDVFADEYAHKEEHSLEFQAVFLKYLFPDRDIPVVPILCGSFHNMVMDKQSPLTAPVVSQFVQGLKDVLNASGKCVSFIAGVDLSHVGPRFGDEEPLSDVFLEGVEKTDRELLAAAEQMDADAYFEVVIRECDRTRVCGTSSIYTMLHAIEATRGQLLKYDQAVDYETQQMVSFASMAFY